MSKTVVTLFHGDKGGVGKSLFCNVYTDIQIKKEKDIILVDSDTQNPDISWTYKDVIEVHLIDLKQHDGWMDFADLVQANQGKEIIVSLPAGIGFQLQEEIEFITDMFNALNIELKMYFPIDRQKTSILQLKKAMETFDGLMKTENITVIKNGFFGAKEEKFYRWNNSKLKETFLTDKGKEIFVPELHERVVDAVERIPFSVALKNGDLVFSIKIELERWLKETTKILE